MFRSFGLKENPFHVSPDPRFLFSGPAYETAIAELMFGIQAHCGLLVLTGEAGTGKTTLMRHFLQWLNVRHFSSAYIFHAHLDPRDLYEFILRDFGIPVEATRKGELLVSLHRWLLLRQAEGDSPVVVIDEAQALSLRTLNELTSMLNLENAGGKLLQIVLAGQPELDEKLRLPESRALRQRIMVRCRLPLLTVEETGEYIETRLRGAGSSLAESTKIFPRQTVETIYSFARGIPRVVNLLCEHGLVGAYADHQTTVCPQNIRRAAAEFDLVGAPFTPVESHLILREPAARTEIARARLDETPEPERTAEVAAPMVEKLPVTTESNAAKDAAERSLEVVSAATSPEEFPIPAELIAAEDVAASQSELIIAVNSMEAVPVPIESKIAEDFAAPLLDVDDAAMLIEELPAAAEFKALESLTEPSLVTAAAFAAVHASAESVAAPAAPPSVVTVPDIKPKIALVAAREIAPKRVTMRAAIAHTPRTYAWRKRREVSAFQRYWQDVASSFIRDWRQFFRSLAPQMATVPALPSFRSDSVREKVMEPVRDWLTKPLNFGTTPRPKSRVRSPGGNSSSKTNERRGARV
jgi:type II secretory pathway predicted ATPase ExeA